MDFTIRNLPVEVNAALLTLLPMKKYSKKGKQNYKGRSQLALDLLCIYALGPDRSPAVYELWHIALRIAKQQRGQDELQPYADVQAKQAREQQEFADIVQSYQQEQAVQADVLAELADILYYSMQAYLHDHDLPAFNCRVSDYCSLAGVSEEQAWQTTLAKYRLRVDTAKNFALEREAIQRVLRPS